MCIRSPDSTFVCTALQHHSMPATFKARHVSLSLDLQQLAYPIFPLCCCTHVQLLYTVEKNICTTKKKEENDACNIKKRTMHALSSCVTLSRALTILQHCEEFHTCCVDASKMSIA